MDTLSMALDLDLPRILELLLTPVWRIVILEQETAKPQMNTKNTMLRILQRTRQEIGGSRSVCSMTILLLMAVFPVTHTLADEVRSDIEDQTGLAVTIYNQDLALVRDQRTIQLDRGVQNLAIRDVSARIRPETALLSTPQGQGTLRLLEQNFDYDLLSPDTLLQKYIGREVRAVTVNPANGNQTIETATVLATNQGVVLKFDDRIETSFPGRLIYDQVPDNLRERPTLVLQVENTRTEPQPIELSYLTRGLSWQADYVASLNDEETRIDLNGWVTLTNASGTRYANALLQLVAGDVQQVEQAIPEMGQMRMAAASAPVSDMVEEALFDYHLYTLQRPTTIANQQTKQVALMHGSSIPVTKRYVVDSRGQFYRGSMTGSQDLDVAVQLDISNDEASNLGQPLPAGVVRVYKNDSDGRTQFIGEDRIDHTPRDGEFTLTLGNAFDVKAEKVQTAFKKKASLGQYNFSAEITLRIILTNSKDQKVDVTLREYVPGDWQMLDQSSPHTKLSSNQVEWTVSVEPNGETVHEYTALVRY